MEGREGEHRTDQGGSRRRELEVVRRHERDLVGLCREANGGDITRRQFIERCLVLGLSATSVGALAAACGGDEGAPTDPATGSVVPMDETRPAEIVFYNWTDYIDPKILRQFRAETGINVREQFPGCEELLAKLKAGATGIDVLVPSDYMVAIMRKSDLLDPLEMEYLPNFRYVGESFRDPVYDDPSQQGGSRYSVPYFYGTTGYCQRLDKVPQRQTSWDALWDRGNKGRVNLLDDERECVGMALKRRGFSANTTVQAELEQATEDLIEQKPLVAVYDSVNMKRAMVQGQAFVMCWDGDVLMALDALGNDVETKRQLQWVLPEEGFIRWCDALVIPKAAASRYGAHLWIDYLMGPKIAGQNASWTKYLSPVAPASWEYTDPEALLLRPSDDDLARSEQLTDVGEFATAYSDAWRQVKSA